MDHPFSLAKQKILVIGGSSGMGFGAARLADQLGAEVIIASHNEDKLQKALGQLSSKASYVAVDVADQVSIRELFEQVDSFDHLFVTAGPGSRSMFKEDATEAARDYFEGKFWSTYQLTKVAVEKINARGSMGYVSGGYAIRPDVGSVPTTAAQNALEGLAKALAIELAAIRFNVIRLGLINTSLWDFMEEKEREEMMQQELKQYR